MSKKNNGLSIEEDGPEEVILNLEWEGDFKSDVSLKTLLAKLDKGIKRRKRLIIGKTKEEKERLRAFK